MIVGYGDGTSFCQVCNMEFPNNLDEHVIYNKHKKAIKTLKSHDSQVVCALCHMLQTKSVWMLTRLTKSI